MFGFVKKFFSPLAKKIGSLIFQSEESFDELEQIFYEADLGSTMSVELVEKVRVFHKKNERAQTSEILEFIKSELLKLFSTPPLRTLSKPHVILVVGVNGSGKTTSIGKMAHFYKSQGKKVLIAAGDTFRAAAVQQLELWAHKVGADIVKAQSGSDPSSVAFDALSAALSRDIDIVLIDTAGRLQTKTDLMHELSKMKKVCQKQIPDAPHETLLVLDATLGQNALDQAKTFHAFTPITSIALTKLDGSARGGIAIAIQKELSIPISWIGTGEKEQDFAPFDARSYLDALFAT